MFIQTDSLFEFSQVGNYLTDAWSSVIDPIKISQDFDEQVETRIPETVLITNSVNINRNFVSELRIFTPNAERQVSSRIM